MVSYVNITPVVLLCLLLIDFDSFANATSSSTCITNCLLTKTVATQTLTRIAEAQYYLTRRVTQTSTFHTGTAALTAAPPPDGHVLPDLYNNSEKPIIVSSNPYGVAPNSNGINVPPLLSKPTAIPPLLSGDLPSLLQPTLLPLPQIQQKIQQSIIPTNAELPINQPSLLMASLNTPYKPNAIQSITATNNAQRKALLAGKAITTAPLMTVKYTPLRLDQAAATISQVTDNNTIFSLQTVSLLTKQTIGFPSLIPIATGVSLSRRAESLSINGTTAIYNNMVGSRGEIPLKQQIASGAEPIDARTSSSSTTTTQPSNKNGLLGDILKPSSQSIDTSNNTHIIKKTDATISQRIIQMLSISKTPTIVTISPTVTTTKISSQLPFQNSIYQIPEQQPPLSVSLIFSKTLSETITRTQSDTIVSTNTVSIDVHNSSTATATIANTSVSTLSAFATITTKVVEDSPFSLKTATAATVTSFNTVTASISASSSQLITNTLSIFSIEKDYINKISTATATATNTMTNTMTNTITDIKNQTQIQTQLQTLTQTIGSSLFITETVAFNSTSFITVIPSSSSSYKNSVWIDEIEKDIADRLALSTHTSLKSLIITMSPSATTITLNNTISTKETITATVASTRQVDFVSTKVLTETVQSNKYATVTIFSKDQNFTQSTLSSSSGGLLFSSVMRIIRNELSSIPVSGTISNIPSHSSLSANPNATTVTSVVQPTQQPDLALLLQLVSQLKRETKSFTNTQESKSSSDLLAAITESTATETSTQQQSSVYLITKSVLVTESHSVPTSSSSAMTTSVVLLSQTRHVTNNNSLPTSTAVAAPEEELMMKGPSLDFSNFLRLFREPSFITQTMESVRFVFTTTATSPASLVAESVERHTAMQTKTLENIPTVATSVSASSALSSSCKIGACLASKVIHITKTNPIITHTKEEDSTAVITGNPKVKILYESLPGILGNHYNSTMNNFITSSSPSHTSTSPTLVFVAESVKKHI